jgi:hypothetical protein
MNALRLGGLIDDDKLRAILFYWRRWLQHRVRFRSDKSAVVANQPGRSRLIAIFAAS